MSTYTGKPGEKIELPDDYNELDIFRYYVSNALIDYITEQINIYAAQYIATNPAMRPRALAKSWKDVTTIDPVLS